MRLYEIACFLEQEPGLKDISRSYWSHLSVSQVLLGREGNHRTHKMGSEVLVLLNPSGDSYGLVKFETIWHVPHFRLRRLLGSISVCFLIPQSGLFLKEDGTAVSWSQGAPPCWPFQELVRWCPNLERLAWTAKVSCTLSFWENHFFSLSQVGGLPPGQYFLTLRVIYS